MVLNKFLSLPHTIDNLVKRRLKIATFRDLNDPFELRGASISNSNLYNRILTDVLAESGVLCFSISDCEPLLWSHYADNHRGCCLVLEVAPHIVALHPTIPIDTPRSFDIDMEAIIEAFREVESSGRHPITETDPILQRQDLLEPLNKVTNDIWLSKYKGWSYEKEIRMLIELSPEQKDGQLYFADFDEGIRPVEVLLGTRCSDADEQELRYAVNRYTPAIPISRMVLAQDSFEIVRRTKP